MYAGPSARWQVIPDSPDSAEPKVFHQSFRYQAASWEVDRRVVAKVVRHSRYVIFQPAEVAVPRELFGAILGRIQQLAPAPT